MSLKSIRGSSIKINLLAKANKAPIKGTSSVPRPSGKRRWLLSIRLLLIRLPQGLPIMPAPINKKFARVAAGFESVAGIPFKLHFKNFLSDSSILSQEQVTISDFSSSAFFVKNFAGVASEDIVAVKE